MPQQQILSTDELLKKYGAGTPEPAPAEAEDAPLMSVLPGVVSRSALQGGTVGSADEILGWLGGDADQARAQLAKDRAAYPKTAMASEIIGSILPVLLTGGGAALGSAANIARGVGVPVAKSLLRRVAGGAAQGAARGAGYGAFSADPGSRAGGAAFGAGVGGVLGSAIPVAGSAVGAVGKKLAGRKATQQSGLSPSVLPVVREAAAADAATAPGNFAAAGKQAMMADAGPAMSAVADAATQGSSRAGAAARSALGTRAQASAQQVTSALDDALGSPPTRAAHLAKYRDPKVSEAYEGAYKELLNADTAKLLRQRATPSDLRRAAVIAKREGVEITNGIPGPGGKERSAYNVRAVDYVTRAMRDSARKKKNQTGGFSSEARGLFKAADDIRQSAFEKHPTYREAVNLATPKLRQQEALRAGENAFKGTREELKEEVAGMTADELDTVATGMRIAIDDKMARVRKAFADPNADVKEASKVLQELSSRDSRDRMQIVLGDRSAPLVEALDEASRTFSLSGRMADNSRTFARQSVRQAMDDELPQTGANIIRTLMGARYGNIPSSLGQTGGRAAREAQSDELIRLMMSPGRESTMQRITQSVNPQSTRDAVRQWAEGLLSTTLHGPGQAVTASGQR